MQQLFPGFQIPVILSFLPVRIKVVFCPFFAWILSKFRPVLLRTKVVPSSYHVRSFSVAIEANRERA